MWAKMANNSYAFYLLRDKSVLFSFENGIFLCKSSEELCGEIE